MITLYTMAVKAIGSSPVYGAWLDMTGVRRYYIAGVPGKIIIF